MDWWRRWTLGAGVSLAVIASTAACTVPSETADDRDSAAGEASRAPVTFTATEFRYDGPSSFPAGLTEVELVNEGSFSHSLVIVGLADGKTPDDVVDILDDEGPIPGWVTFAGGVGGIPPGSRSSVVHDFEPGQYAVFSFESAPGEDVPDAAKGMIQALEVTEADGTAAGLPEVDVELDLVDMAFDLAGGFQAGTQTVLVQNNGAQPHEALIMKLSPGVSADDVVGMITGFGSGGPESEGASPDSADSSSESEGEMEEAGTGVDAGSGEGAPDGAPFESAGGAAPLDPGEESYITLELEPGDYVLLCFIPDTGDGAMHLTKGMYRSFTVE
jgi:hypothetical protein